MISLNKSCSDANILLTKYNIPLKYVYDHAKDIFTTINDSFSQTRKVPKILNYFWLSSHLLNYINNDDFHILYNNICKFAQDPEWDFTLWVDNSFIYYQNANFLYYAKVGANLQFFCNIYDYRNPFLPYSYKADLQIKNINDDSNLKLSKQVYSLADSKYLGIRVDAVKYDVAYNYGGFIADVDLMCTDVYYINTIIDKYNFFASYGNNFYTFNINNFAVTPKHPALKFVNSYNLQESIDYYSYFCQHTINIVDKVACVTKYTTASILGLEYIKYKTSHNESLLSDLILLNHSIDNDECVKVQTEFYHNDSVEYEEISLFCNINQFWQEEIMCGIVTCTDQIDHVSWIRNAFPEFIINV